MNFVMTSTLKLSVVKYLFIFTYAKEGKCTKLLSLTNIKYIEVKMQNSPQK
jgi:hypothetical protein